MFPPSFFGARMGLLGTLHVKTAVSNTAESAPSPPPREPELSSLMAINEGDGARDTRQEKTCLVW